MDFAGRINKKMSKKSKNKNSNSSLMKVVYISSPMKVKTSASRFRTLVQELTGRDSDISRYPTSSDSSSDSQFQDFDDEIMPQFKSKSNLDHHHHLQQQQLQLQMQKSMFESSPSSSESMVEQEHEDQQQPPSFDDAFISEGFFQGLLASDLMFSTDSSNDQFDVLGSYDSL